MRLLIIIPLLTSCAIGPNWEVVTLNEARKHNKSSEGPKGMCIGSCEFCSQFDLPWREK